MKKLIYALFLLCFVSNANAHKPHDDVLLQNLQGIASKEAIKIISSNIKDFSLESHFVYKNTQADNTLLNVLTRDDFNKKAYVDALREVYKNNNYVKDVSFTKSANAIAKLNKRDRSVLANVLKTAQ